MLWTFPSFHLNTLVGYLGDNFWKVVFYDICFCAGRKKYVSNVFQWCYQKKLGFHGLSIMLAQLPSWHNFPMEQLPPGTTSLWNNFPLAQLPNGLTFPIHTTSLWHNFPLAQLPYGTTSPWHNLSWHKFPVAQVPMAQLPEAGWAWWSLFLCSPSTPPLPHRHPQSIKLCSLQIFIVLILRATFCGGFGNFSTADYRVGRGLELWKGQRRVYSSSSSSLFSYLWRMSCKGEHFRSWLKIGQAGSDLPQFPLVLCLPYVVCQGVKSSFKLQWKWITTCACVACAEVLKKGSRMPLIPQ